MGFLGFGWYFALPVAGNEQTPGIYSATGEIAWRPSSVFVWMLCKGYCTEFPVELLWLAVIAHIVVSIDECRRHRAICRAMGEASESIWVAIAVVLVPAPIG